MSIALSSGTLALVGVIDTLRKAERPMSAALLSRRIGASVSEVEHELCRLKQAQQLTVYTIAQREYYELKESA